MLTAATAANEKLATESAHAQQDLGAAREKLGVYQSKVSDILEFARKVKDQSDPDAVDSLLRALEGFDTESKDEGVLRQFSFAESS